MKIGLIVTLGARDLQLQNDFEFDERLAKVEKPENYPDKEHKGMVALKNPRDAGTLINIHYDAFEPHISFPIVKPAIDYVLEGHRKIDNLVIVVTDQRDANFRNKDTAFFGRVLKKFVERHYTSLISRTTEVVFRENLLDYDFNYKTSEAHVQKVFADSKAWKVFLLPQGGIDAINIAILLRCMERFKYFSQLAKPEGYEGIIKQVFPDSFRNMLNRQRLLHSVENYNYAAIDEGLTDNPYVLMLAKYAYFRLGLDYDKAWEISSNFVPETNDLAARLFSEELRKAVARKNGLHDILALQSDLFVFVKMRWQQGYYADFLMRLFALSENILIPVIENYFKTIIVFNERDNHRLWRDFLDAQPDLKQFMQLERINNVPVFSDYPNRHAFIIINRYLLQNKLISADKSLGEKSLTAMNVLAILRNRIAHGLMGVSEDLIIDELNKGGHNLSNLFDNLNKYFGFTGDGDFGIYNRINQQIIYRCV